MATVKVDYQAKRSVQFVNDWRNGPVRHDFDGRAIFFRDHFDRADYYGWR